MILSRTGRSLFSTFIAATAATAVLFCAEASFAVNSCQELFQVSVGNLHAVGSKPRENAPNIKAENEETRRETKWTSVQSKNLQHLSVVVIRVLTRPFRAQVFSRSRFSERKQFYRAHLGDLANSGSNLEVPTRAEDRLALFEAVSESLGSLGLEGISNWVDVSSARDLGRFARSLSQARLNKGWSESEVELTFSKLYFMSHVDPRNWREILNRPISETLQLLIAERARMELGRNRFPEAFRNLGLIRSSGQIEKMGQWRLKNADVVEAAYTVGLNTVSIGMSGFVMRPPNVRNLMSRPQFSSATLQILNEQGWEAAMPYLRREAGMKPQAELALSVSTRIAGTLMMGIAVAYAAPMLLHAVVPPGYADDDGFFDLIGDVSSYWTLKAREVIEPGSTARGANDSGPTSSQENPDAATRNQQNLQALVSDLDS